MSGTQSIIGIRNSDNTFDFISCYLDGYPTGVGKTLQEHYRTEERIRELIAHGNLSSLGQDIEKREGDHSLSCRQKGVCVFYERDGETHHRSLDSNNSASRNVNMAALREICECYEWVYIFHPEQDKWIVRSKSVATSLDKAIRIYTDRYFPDKDAEPEAKPEEEPTPGGGNIELIRQGDVCKTCKEAKCGFNPASMRIMREMTQARQAKGNTSLFGETIPAPAVPARQLTLFDPPDYPRESSGIPAVVCRENGEKASGQLDMSWAKKPPKYMKPTYVFVAETGNKYYICTNTCKVTFAGGVAVIKISEAELSRRVSLYGMFASCCLF